MNFPCLLDHSNGSKFRKGFSQFVMVISYVMWWALDRHKVPTKYVALIKDMYNNVMIRVRTSDGDTDDFPIKIGLHQGPALSPYLFALVMDEVTKNIQGDIPWCMLFADDVVS